MALLGRLQKVEQSRLHVTGNASPTMNNKITTQIIGRHKDSGFLSSELDELQGFAK